MSISVVVPQKVVRALLRPLKPIECNSLHKFFQWWNFKKSLTCVGIFYV